MAHKTLYDRQHAAMSAAGRDGMKPYCTQNNGECATCALVNYGRDCANHEGADWAITVSGACPTFHGPELVAVLSWRETCIEAARRERARLEQEMGRIMYLSKVCDL
jgi:hypothetical protein